MKGGFIMTMEMNKVLGTIIVVTIASVGIVDVLLILIIDKLDRVIDGLNSISENLHIMRNDTRDMRNDLKASMKVLQAKGGWSRND